MIAPFHVFLDSKYYHYFSEEELVKPESILCMSVAVCCQEREDDEAHDECPLPPLCTFSMHLTWKKPTEPDLFLIRRLSGM